jgi:hypothetical protein
MAEVKTETRIKNTNNALLYIKVDLLPTHSRHIIPEPSGRLSVFAKKHGASHSNFTEIPSRHR